MDGESFVEGEIPDLDLKGSGRASLVKEEEGEIILGRRTGMGECGTFRKLQV